MTYNELRTPEIWPHTPYSGRSESSKVQCVLTSGYPYPPKFVLFRCALNGGHLPLVLVHYLPIQVIAYPQNLLFKCALNGGHSPLVLVHLSELFTTLVIRTRGVWIAEDAL